MTLAIAFPQVHGLVRERQAIERVATGLNVAFRGFWLEAPEAVLEGLSATASVITSAALIMIVVFGAFAFARVLVMQFLGFGLAVAVPALRLSE